MMSERRCHICGQPLKDGDDTISMYAHQIGGQPKLLTVHKACAAKKK